MLSLSIKDIREVFSDTLFKFYSLSDFSISSTKVKDKDKEFRIEFRIYDKDLEAFFDAFHEALVDQVEKKQKTTAASVYGSSTLVDEPKSVVAQCIDAVYGSTKVDESKVGEAKPSIFNGLDDQDDRDEYI